MSLSARHRPGLSRRQLLSLAGAGLAPLAAAGPGRADERGAVDLELVLAVDASGSVNQRRFELQKQGYVAAFRDPRVLKAIRTGANSAIAATMVQWTGPNQQVQVVPWGVIRDDGTARAFSQRIENAPRQLFGGGTSISGAIDNALTLFTPGTSARRVVDVSGDGANNRGRPAADARDDAIRAGITINGLPILEIERDLEEFYRSNVIGGANAFLVVANTFEEFGDAIIKKLVTEIAAPAGMAHRVG